MVSFDSGPACGRVLLLRRAPPLLRVSVAADGQVDALDLLTDRPEAGETLHAYCRIGPARRVHIRSCDHRTGHSTSGTYALASYRLVDPQPSQEAMRSTSSWRTWATAAARERGDDRRQSERATP